MHSQTTVLPTQYRSIDPSIGKVMGRHGEACWQVIATPLLPQQQLAVIRQVNLFHDVFNGVTKHGLPVPHSYQLLFYI